MLKILGACFLVVGGYFWGESIARKKKKRYQLLLEWSQILMDIEGEIRTMATPLPVLLIEIGKKSKSEIGDILIETGNRMQRREHLSFSEIWEEELKKVNLEVEKDELDRMISVGKNLGFLDKSQQVLFLQQSRQEFKIPIETAFTQWKDAKGFYEKIGILAASMMVIMLL